MKNFFFAIVFLYGLGLSYFFGTWVVKDMIALEQAVAVGSERAEMRHRINVFADGTWFLLSNIMVISSVYGMKKIKGNEE
jgi:uncharacterized membrane protein